MKFYTNLIQTEMDRSSRLYLYFIVLFSNLACGALTTTTGTDTLRLVHLLYRHGDRSPAHTYPGNPVKESDWPQGLGQLTQIGIQQSYFLGNLLHKRYVQTGFMKLAYNASEIYVRSTDKDRTLMTAYSVLAGLYPPNGTQVWNKEFPWQPIPVHTVPLVDDYLLRDDAPCPKFDRLVKEFRQNSKELKKFIFKNQDLIKLIHIKTGMPADPLSMFRVLDPVHCERLHEKDFNLTLADWVKNDTIAGRLLEARNFVSTIRFASPKIARLRAGLLIKTILENIDKTVNGNTDVKKMYMYSAHDTTANALMRVLNVFNNLAPPYSACVIVEFHETAKGIYDVRVFYRNETDSENMHQLKIPDCPDINCPLENFKSLMKDMIPVDIKQECGLERNVQTNTVDKSSTVVAYLSNNHISLGYVLGFICACLCLAFYLHIRRKHIRSGHRYCSFSLLSWSFTNRPNCSDCNFP